MVLSFQHIGRRKTQEDALLVDEKKGLYLVCDGIGGFDQGEFASQFIISSIVSFFEEKKDKAFKSEWVIESIKNAQYELNQVMKNRSYNSKIGTTIAFLYLQNEVAITAHMGDSRILRIKNNSSDFWTTKDHSIVQELFDADILKSKADMQKHPMKHKITNAIFSGQDPKTISVTTHQFKDISKGDKFALFTDGILETFSETEIAEFIKKPNLGMTFYKISNQIKKTSSDNSSMIILEV